MTIPVDIEVFIDEKSEEMVSKNFDLKSAVRCFEKGFIEMIMKKTDGDTEKASEFLNIPKFSLISKMNGNE